MIPALFAMWAISAPMGFLAGDVFATRNQMDHDIRLGLPWLAALIPPLGMILALMSIIQAEATDTEDEDHV